MCLHYAVEQDEGVYEYVNEDTMAVDRATTMNDTEVTVAADQTDVVHQAVLGQFNRASSSGVAAKVSGTSLRCGSVQAADVAGDEKGETDSQNPDSDEEESHLLLDPQPFAGIMGRLGLLGGRAPSATPTAAPAATQKRTAAASANGSTSAQAASGPSAKKAKASSSNTKKNPVHEAGDASAPAKKRSKESMPPQEPSRVKAEPTSPNADHADEFQAPSGFGPEDSKMLSNYYDLIREVGNLDVKPGTDDGDFNQWAKGHVSKISELRRSILGKKKSLNRRKSSDVDEIVETLTGYQERLGELSEFVKCWVGATALTGRQIEEMAQKLIDSGVATLSAGVWERVLKAVAFEDGQLFNQLEV